MTNQPKTLTLTVGDDGIAVVTMDVPGEKQNTLRDAFAAEFEEIVATLEESDAIRAVVFVSGKPDTFLAGADISMLERVESAAEATALSRQGQRAFDRLEAASVPVVAAIHGACLGGGLELALACAGRVATDDRRTKLGVPEVQLGLLPGAGGTYRLPRLVGLQQALDLLLTGKQLDAKRAKKIGLVDQVVPHANLLRAATALARNLADLRATGIRAGKPKKDLQRRFIDETALGRGIAFKKAAEGVAKKAHGNYPAPLKILEAVRAGMEFGAATGLETEARLFGELVMTPESRQLRGIFFATQAMKKDNGVDDASVQARPVRHVGVLGAGLMGAGIAGVSLLRADLPVRLKDRDDDGLRRGLQQVDRFLAGRQKRGAMSPYEKLQTLNRLTTTTGVAGFLGCDVVIEAVFEDLALKHRVLAEIEANTGDTTIFGSNTSSIPISRIAAAAKRPGNVIGLHYFSPVEKMPLLEIVVTEWTHPEVIATSVELGRRQGKTVIVVRDGVGFYTSRILAPYLNEAAWLVSEGVAIDAIDKALVKWGFPVGPITLLDEVGVDVASKVGPFLLDAFGERMRAPGTTETLIRDGRLGRKAKKGFYRYDKDYKGDRPVDAAVYDVIGVHPGTKIDEADIAERCVLMMVNEAVRCLDEGILRSARDGDIGAIFGLGFAPFRGGPFRYADTIGVARLVDRLRHWEAKAGARFAPAPLLLKMVKSSTTFHTS